MTIHLIGSDIIGDSEPYLHCWLYAYNVSVKEWRCFQITHFRHVSMIDAVLKEDKGEIHIISTGNDDTHGTVITTFNLIATSK